MSEERKKLKKRLDDVFSLFIRERDGYKCQVCGKTKEMAVIQCGHFHSRGSNSTRWDEMNCMAQCASCNKYHNYDKEPMRQALLRKITQDQYDLLYMKYRKSCKFTENDLKILIKLYNQKRKEWRTRHGRYTEI